MSNTAIYITNSEFGWECIHWQAYCRAISENYERNIYITVNTGSGYLYEDFAKPLEFNGPSIVRSDVFLYNKHRKISFEKQKFIKYGGVADFKTYPILFHARYFKNPNVNYSMLNWIEVADYICRNYEVASIGTKDHAMHIPGTEDLRGIGLDKLALYMSNAKLLIGPNSGPMHFAQLCGCPVLAWTTREPSYKELIRDRLKSTWNPFKTPAYVLDKYGWQPTPDQVCEYFGGVTYG